MSISPERKRCGDRLQIGPNYLEYSFETDKKTGEKSVYLENLYYLKPKIGEELIRNLVNEVGRGVQVTETVIEPKFRKRLIKEGLFSQLISQPVGACLSVDQKLWPKLEAVRILQKGGLKVQEVVLERLKNNLGMMLDRWDIAVWVKAVT